MHVLYGVVLYYAKDSWENTVLSFQRLELEYNQPEVHVFSEHHHFEWVSFGIKQNIAG